MRVYLSASAAALSEAAAARPDGVVLDGRSASPPDSGEARAKLPGRTPLLVRLGDVESADFAIALSGAMALAPHAIVLPVRHGRDVAHAGARLAVAEAQNGLPDGATGIVALIAGALGALHLASLARASPRLCAIGWDAAALGDELEIARPIEDGAWVPPLAQVRVGVRLAAAAAGVAAIEAACPDGTDPARHAGNALRDGFGAVFAADARDLAAIRSAQAGTARR